LWLPPDQSVPVPGMLKHVILQRVSRLGEAAESLLRHAAVVGDTWELDLVERLAGLPEDVLLDGLESVLAAGLIRAVSGQEEAYEFSHGLIQEVLYAGQIPRRRKRLHERIGAYLEQQGAVNAARLAHHYYQAENWEKAYRYCLAAGQEAALSFANNRALDLYQKALDALRRSKQAGIERRLVEIYERLGDTCRVLDLQVEAEAAFRGMQEAARQVGDLRAQGRALSNLVLVHVAQYRQDAAERAAREALGIAGQPGDARLLAQAHGGLGKLLLIGGQLDASADHFNQFRHHGEALRDPETQSDLLRQQAYLALWAGRYAESQGLAQQCLDEGLKSGNLLHIAGGYQILSISQIEAGRYGDAYRNIRAILNQTERAGAYHHQLPRLLNQMGYLFLELGDAGQALAWDERAWAATAEARRESRQEMKRYCLLNMASDLLRLDRVAEGREYAARCEAIIEAPEYARFRYRNRYLLLMSELRLAESDFPQSIAFAQEARAFAAAYGARKNIAKSHWLEGQALLAMKERSGAVGHLEQAVALADAIQHGSLRWRVRLSLAQALSSVGRSTEECAEAARAIIGQIHESLAGSSLGDSFDGNRRLAQLNELTELDRLARFEAFASATGRIGKTPPERPAYPAGLTGREVEILRLVASGATNRQVADALTISPRTVNTHITSILNKTGCENRTAASAFAAKHNLLSA
jgi:DNA-binding CsgD family transcriptional regulator